MLAFEITGNALKNIMRQLLVGDAFDGFFVRGVEICALTKFEMSGILDKGFAAEEGKEPPSRNFCLWSELKPYAYGLVKGSKKPRAMRIVLSLPDEQAKGMHENAAALFLNMSFDADKLTLTTVTSQKIFTMDKSMDHAWEEYVSNFFKSLGCAVSTLS
jgi:hypothetical protein